MLRRERIFVALSSAGAVAVIAYALLRVVERSFFPEPNPAALIWPSRSSFVWRSLLALYAGGMGGFGGYALASRAPEAIGRWLRIAVIGAALLLLLQTALAP